MKQYINYHNNLNKMRNITRTIGSFLLGLALSTPLFAQTGPAQDATLLWSDEFDGTALNPNLWCIETGEGIWNTGGNHELQMYKAENVSVANSKLTITAKREVSGNYQFTSGRIKTSYKVTAKKGWITARIKIPDLRNGIWPAFWMLGATEQGWPACGEIDIMEMGHSVAMDQGGSNLVNSYSTGYLHWSNAGTYASYGTGGYIPTKATAVDLSQDFHEFKLYWNDTQIKTFVDDVQTFVMTTSSVPAFVDNAFFTILNLAVGGSITGITNPANITAPFPAEMVIDYVRVYDDNGKGVVNLDPNGNCINTTSLVKPTATNYGVYTESKKQNCEQGVTFDSDVALYVWDNTFGVAPAYTPSFEGTSNLVINPYSVGWYGGAITCIPGGTYKDMTNYKDGYLHFAVFIPTTTTSSFRVFINAGDVAHSYNFTAPTFRGLQKGQWNELYVKLTDFGSGIDFTNVTQLFGVGNSGTYTAGQTIGFDDIYWTKTNTPTALGSVKAIEKASFTISPNPASNGNVTISSTEAFGNENILISIIEISGKIISTKQVANSSDIQLSTADLASGIYIVVISDANTIGQQKLIIR